VRRRKIGFVVALLLLLLLLHRFVRAVQMLFPRSVLVHGQDAFEGHKEGGEEEEKRSGEDEEEGAEAPHFEDDATQQRPAKSPERRTLPKGRCLDEYQENSA